MHAYLVISQDPKSAQEHVKIMLKNEGISLYDTRIFVKDPEKHSIGVKDIRQFITASGLRPVYGKFQAVVIFEAEKMTIEAQNTLLKTLEEPPPMTQIFLASSTKENLLETIISRCRLIHVKNPIRQNQPSEIISLMNKSPGEIISYSQANIKKTEDAAMLFDSLLIDISQKQSPKDFSSNFMLSRMAKILLDAKKALPVNVNPKLIFENAVFMIKKSLK